MKIETYKNISQTTLEKNPNVLYIIEDNDMETNYNSICSSENFDNLVCLKTKKNNTKKRGDLYNDKNFNINKENILSNFLDIRYKLTKYENVSLKETGYGNYLKSYSPKTYEFISNMIKHNLCFNNDKGIYIKRIPSYNEIIKSKELDISYYNSIKTELIKNKKSTSITTINEEFELGDILRLKHKKTLDEIICEVITPSYSIKKISSDRLNLFEGYTKASNGKRIFNIDYIGNIKSGVITFSDDYMNKTQPTNKEEVVENKNTELGIDVVSEINKEIVKQTKPFKLEVEEVEEILEKSNKETHNNKSSNWFGVDDFKTNLDNFIKNICLDDNPSILDLKNSNYLIASDMYLHEINYFDKKFRIKSKIKLIDYKIVDLFGVTNLFTKEEIYGQNRITCFKIRNINTDLVDEFLKSKFK